MIRRTVATLIALVSLFALGACSSSDNAKKVDESAATTQTTVEETTTTTGGGGLKSKIDLGGLADESNGEITAKDEQCVEDGVSNDPSLSSYESFEDLQAGPQADQEAFFGIFINCVGSETVIDLFMDGFSQSGTFTDAQLACVRTEVEALGPDAGAKLLAGDTAITETLTTDIAANCISG